MGSVGDTYDNAMAESFFASLECELIDRRSFQTNADARLAWFTYIEGWYNPRRRHSALGRIFAVNFERNQVHHESPLHNNAVAAPQPAENQAENCPRTGATPSTAAFVR
jgi:putative transposase